MSFSKHVETMAGWDNLHEWQASQFGVVTVEPIPTPEQYLKQLETEACEAVQDLDHGMVRLEQIGKDLIRFKRARVKQELEHKGRK